MFPTHRNRCCFFNHSIVVAWASVTVVSTTSVPESVGKVSVGTVTDSISIATASGVVAVVSLFFLLSSASFFEHAATETMPSTAMAKKIFFIMVKRELVMCFCVFYLVCLLCVHCVSQRIVVCGKLYGTYGGEGGAARVKSGPACCCMRNTNACMSFA